MAMFKQSQPLKRWGPLLLCMPLLVKAETATAPSAEFWQYLVEFSDEQGELIDPEDLAAVENLNNEGAVAAEPATKATKEAMQHSSQETKQHSSSAMNINNEQKEANL